MTKSTVHEWLGDRWPDWTKAPVARKSGAVSPFTVADLERAVNDGTLRTPYLEMVRADRRDVPLEDYTLTRDVAGTSVHGIADPAGVQNCLKAGATLLLRDVDQWHRPTRDLCARVTAETGRDAQAFVFLTPADTQGLTTHRDDADVLVVQIDGRKNWYVGSGPATAHWLAGDLGRGEKDRATLRCTLSPGDVLHVPRGFAHHATSAGTASLHLSVTVRDTTTADLRSIVERELAAGLDLPPLPLGEPAIREAAERLLTHYRARLATLTVDDLLPARSVGSVNEFRIGDLRARRSPWRRLVG